jgi:hypothetical protein
VIAAFLTSLPWGILGVASAYAIMSVIPTYPHFAISLRLVDMRVRELGLVLWQRLVCSLSMLGNFRALRFELTNDMASYWILMSLLVAGGVTHPMLSALINRAKVRELMSLIEVRQ